MNAAAAFSTGISVRWPRADRHRMAADTAPFDEEDVDAALLHANHAAESSQSRDSSSARSAHSLRSDRESYSGCQELAYQYAVEQTKSTVRTVLLKANSNCYHQVLRYFERYMSVASASAPTPTNSQSSAALTSALDALVEFPEFHGFPTAAVLAGTDATVSDVWVNPLCQVLQRSFPLVFVVKEDFQNARRMVEWMAEHLDTVKHMRASEESWLLAQIDGFDMLDTPTDSAARDRGSAAVDRLATLRSRSKRGASSYARAGDAAKAQSEGNGDDDRSDDEFVAFKSGDDSDEDSDDSNDSGVWRRVARKKRRHTGGRSAAKSKGAPSATAADRTYSKWTMEQLLVRIQTELEVSLGPDDPCKMWLATLRELVDVRLEAALHEREHDLTRSIQSFNDAIEWLKTRITACRSLPGRHANANATASVSISATEFSLAQILHAVMHRFLAFLDHACECAAAGERTDSPAVAATAADPAAAASTAAERSTRKSQEPHESLAGLWRLRISGIIKRHEDYYQLHHYSVKQQDQRAAQRPFVLLCIEQLETFSQQVLDDFLVTWTNFARQRGVIESAAARMGFIVGVASAASPALRHLNLSIVSQLDMQFFSLEDSRKCFDDILEALVVDANLPLALGGDVLRWVASRHCTTQSIALFLHALAFLFFEHFKRVKWSFLSHFCLDAHWRRPLQSVQAPSKRLALWLRRAAVRASTLQDYLLLFSDAKLEELRQLVFPVVAPEGDWLEVLLDEVAWMREQRAHWGVGWKCFRAACSWLEITLRGDEFTACLADALDGKLANTPKMHVAMQRLETCSLRVATGLLEDWRTICAASARRRAASGSESADTSMSALAALAQHLDELALVCRYAMEREKQSATKPMLPRLRDEITSTFCERLVVALVQPPRTRLAHRLVLQWLSVTATHTLEQRLHINYYDKLKEMLLEIEDGEHGGGHADGTSWVNDVSLAFLYYQESAGIYLSLRDWYETFAHALADEFAARRRDGGKKARSGGGNDTGSSAECEAAVEVETKARFLRAFCTLRHWGFVKSLGSSQSSDGDTIEKVVFI